jgi:hypothetical protein
VATFGRKVGEPSWFALKLFLIPASGAEDCFLLLLHPHGFALSSISLSERQLREMLSFVAQGNEE